MVKFDPLTHTYTKDGQVLPSTTEIIGTVLYPSSFSFVNPDVLNAAIERGNHIHAALESGFIDPLTDDELHSYNEAIRLLKEHNIEIISQEVIVHSKLGYMGKYDVYAKMGDDYILLDYKSGTSLNRKRTALQQSFYKVAWEEMGNRVDKIYAMHLPKHKTGRLVELKAKPESVVAYIMREYERIKDENNQR